MEVMRSGRLRQGEICTEFEIRFADSVGARHAVTVSSGTAALHLAWMALLRSGDEVLVPAFTFFATASTVVLAGGRPVFCDVSPTTFTIDIDDARRRVTNRTVAIAPVHLYGQSCDVDSVKALADEAKLHVVWDAAQAHATKFENSDVGSLDDMCCYSFYPTKNMTTGEGGMITTNDDALAERLRLLRSHGQTRKYYHTMMGMNYRLTDVQAAIGLVQLERLPGLVEQRRQHARQLSHTLDAVEGVRPPVEQPGTIHSYHQYTVVVDGSGDGVKRDALSSALRASGIETAIHYPTPLHRQPVFERETSGISLPVSERLSSSVLSLPVHPALSSRDVEHVGDAVRAAMGPK